MITDETGELLPALNRPSSVLLILVKLETAALFPLIGPTQTLV